MGARRAETQARFATADPRRGTHQHQPYCSGAQRVGHEESFMGMMDDDDTVYCDVQMPITAPTHGAEDTSPIFM